MTDQQYGLIAQSISEGNLEKAISQLQSLSWNKDQQQVLLAIVAQFQILRRKISQGTLSQEWEQLQQNQLTERLIDFIDNAKDPARNVKDLRYITEGGRKNHHVNGLWITAGIGFALVLGIVLAFYFIRDHENLQLTVFVTDSNGNVAIEKGGRLNIPLGNRSLNEEIGPDGRTNFPDITRSNLGDTITIGLEAEGWEIAGSNRTFVFNGDPIHLRVKKDNSLGLVKGVVKSRDGQEFIAGAQVRINNDTVITTNSLGVFEAVLPLDMQVESVGEAYLLTVSAINYKTSTQYYYPRSSDAEVRLQNK